MTKREFSELVERYQALVFTVCMQMVCNRDDAADLVQATFLSAWQHSDSCPAGFERQWLMRIAANKAKDYLKSAQRRVVPVDSQQNVFFMGQSPPPDDEVIAKMAAADLERMILSLDEPYLKVAERYFLRRQSVAEISQALRRPPKTVHTQLARAKKILRQNIERSARDEMF